MRLAPFLGTCARGYWAVGGALSRDVLDVALGTPLPRSALRQLEADGLVRFGDRGWVEPWHARLRDEILTGMDAAQTRSDHGALATAWEQCDPSSARTVARHLIGAERSSEAVPWLWRAAEDAEAKLAFEQAALDYQSITTLEPPTVRVLERLARAHDNAGNAERAAEAYTRALGHAAGSEQQRDLRLLAGTRFLYAGRLAEGREALVRVLGDHGFELPRWPTADAILRRARLAVLGMRPRRSPSSLARVDALLGATKGLVMVEPVLADAVAVRALEESTALGDAPRMMQALGLEAVSRANVGGGLLRRSGRQLLERLPALAQQVGTPFASGWVALCRGCSAFFETRFSDAVRDCREGLRVFRTEAVGSWHETNVAMAFLIAALACTGDHEELARLLPDFRSSAAARGDSYAWVALHTAETYYAAIHEGTVEDFIRKADEALQRWPSSPFTSPHYQHGFAKASCLLYLGRAEEAWQTLEAIWPKLQRNGYLQLEWLGGQLRHLRARIAIARGSEAGARLAQGEARRLVSSELPGLQGLGLLLEAAVAHRRGDLAGRDEKRRDARGPLLAAGIGAYVRGLDGGGLSPLSTLLLCS